MSTRRGVSFVERNRVDVLTLVDGDSKVIRDVILSHVEDRVRRRRRRPCSRTRLSEPLALPRLLNVVVHVKHRLATDDLSIGVHGVKLLPVLGRDWQQLPPDGEEIVLIPEVEGDVLASVAEEMVGL